jgi:sulfur-oxidizing protein SoxX
MKRIVCLAALSIVLATPVIAQDKLKVDPAVLEKYVAATWKSAPEDWKARVQQDETQKICTQYNNQPPGDIADQILKGETATVKFPADGNVMGDWKAGEKVAQNGRGGQFTDEPDTVNGGNCYACHQMRPDEVSYGTLGPSLLGYGKARNFDPKEAHAAYAKIYNSQSVLPCSQMPRFGFHKFLTEQQIKDVVALLFDKESPVNK